MAFAITIEGGTEAKHTKVAFINCHSWVDWSKNYSYEMHNYTNGFVEKVGDYADVSFTDCSYVGKWDGLSAHKSGGFVGEASSKASFTLTNCLSVITDYPTSGTTRGYTHYFIGGEGVPVTFTNCYAQQLFSQDGVLGAQGTEAVVTADEVKSGKTAYLLNAGRTGDNAPWAQTLGTDNAPVAKISSPESLEVGKQEATTHKVGTAGWGTLFYPVATTLPNGVKAYTVDEVQDGTLTLTEVEGTVAANTPVILCTLGENETSAAEKTLQIAGVEGSYYNKVGGAADNILKGVYDETAAEDGWYILQDHKETTGAGVAFYQVDTNAAKPNVPANHCYLQLPASAEAKAFLSLPWGDEATGIQGTSISPIATGKIYNLNGQEVKTMQKGHVYIMDGRKLIIK